MKMWVVRNCTSLLYIFQQTLIGLFIIYQFFFTIVLKLGSSLSL